MSEASKEVLAVVIVSVLASIVATLATHWALGNL